MGIATYILIYLLIGYAINLIGAALAPAKEAELKPVIILSITAGWGLFALVIILKAICYPIQFVARVRRRATGEVNNANG